MKSKLAFIIVNTEFSRAAIGDAKILAMFDALTATAVIGEPFVTGDNLNRLEGASPDLHGSVILSGYKERRPEAAFILIRAFDASDRAIRTGWKDGEIETLGWTEYWLEAVRLCQELGYVSVTNLSFGGYVHAMDGGGWESFQLAKLTGPGKPGHVVLAAAGDGNGEAVHASWSLARGQERTIQVWQADRSDFNFWSLDTTGWTLEVWHNGHLKHAFNGADLAANVWNQKQQVNFTVGDPSGMTYLHVSRNEDGPDHPARFSCWVRSGSAWFHNCIDDSLIAEPAVFPHVIAVGLADKRYGTAFAGKPDVILPAGTKPISFRMIEAGDLAAEALLASRHRDQPAVLRAMKRRLRTR